MSAQNQRNWEINRADQMRIYQEQADYTKAVQQETWNREDTAYQRAVADAKSAGLSPLAISGGASAGSIASQPSQPALQAYTGQAAQLDMATAIDAISSLGQLGLEQEKLEFQKVQHNDQLSENEKQRTLQRETTATQTQTQLESLSQSLAQQAEQFSKTQDLENRKLIQNEQLLTKQLSQAMDLKNKDLAHDLSKDIRKTVLSVTGGKSDKYREYDNFDDYQEALVKYANDWATFQEVYGNTRTSIRQTETDSAKSAASAGISQTSLSGEIGTQKSTTLERDGQSEYEAALFKWFNTHPYPIPAY
ncbi:DNA pilot protein [Tortoise microvirus 104]|nr:DNA pilot protein [Tortoise microvirus 6]QCS37450.1 DNA pilot protein [Tortoise microvirus 104]